MPAESTPKREETEMKETWVLAGNSGQSAREQHPCSACVVPLGDRVLRLTLSLTQMMTRCLTSLSKLLFSRKSNHPSKLPLGERENLCVPPLTRETRRAGSALRAPPASEGTGTRSNFQTCPQPDRHTSTTRASKCHVRRGG